MSVLHNSSTSSLRSEITPRDVFNIVMRHRKKVAAFFLLTMAAVLAVVIFFPRTYESSAQLFVRVGRESVTLDPTATVGDSRTFQVHSRREQEIASDLQILKGRGMAENVVDVVGIDTVLERSDEAESESSFFDSLKSLRSALQLDPISDREKAINHLEKHLEITVPNDTSVIIVNYRGGSPEIAQQVVTTMVDLFLKEHPRLNRTEGSQEFFVEQTDHARQRLTEAIDKLGSVKSKLGLTSVEGREQSLETLLSSLETEMLANDSALAWTEARVKALKLSANLLATDREVAGVAGQSQFATEDMRSQLYTLELREKELLAKYSEDYPYVREVRQQLEQARRTLEESAKGSIASSHDLAPVFRDILLRLSEEEPQHRALVAKAEALKSQLAQVRGRISELNANEAELAKLERDAELWQSSYQSYADNLEQARIDWALQHDQISNVNIAQPATLVEKPVSPRKGLLLALGLLFSTLGSLALALTCEWLDHSLKSATEIEEKLRVPVVLTIPEVWNPRVLAS